MARLRRRERCNFPPLFLQASSPFYISFFFHSSMYSYRVLTPTMYRSRMATARQAVSMDYDDDSGAVKKARLRREGPAMRGPSPLLRPGKLLRAQRSSGENSFDLELGASATRVHQLPPANAKYKRLSPNVHQQLSTGKCPLSTFAAFFTLFSKSLSSKPTSKLRLKSCWSVFQE